MTRNEFQPTVHRLAVLTAIVALVPITVGALVTTMQAGMAFLDWPSSDGHNMLLYPWFQSFALASPDKAVEHGHRLGGMLIGILSICLAVGAWRWEKRSWVRYAAFAVLVGVVGQGVLGGIRVLFESNRLALVHGSFGAVVFTLMCCVALVTSRSWFQVPETYSRQDFSHLKPIGFLLVGAICCQYIIGGFLRHEGRALYEHVGFGVLVLLTSLVAGVMAHRTRFRWLQQPGWWLLGLVVVQVLLGVSAFVTKFGWAPTGYVAVAGSMVQTVIRTSHTVVGMLLFMTAVNLLVRITRLEQLRESNGQFQEVAA